MTALELLTQLRSIGVQLEADGERLRVVAPKEVLTPDLSAAIRAHKAELLRHLAPARAVEGTQLRALPRTARTPLSPGQERLWALVARAPESRRFNLPLAFRIAGPLDVDALCRAVAGIVARHDVLRSVIRHDGAQAVTELLDVGDVRVIVREPVASAVSEAWVQQRIRDDANWHFDLASGPLVRLVLVPLGTEDHLLTLTMHHIVADGWSFEIFFDELAAAYEAECRGHAPARAPLPLQYADVAAWQRSRLTVERRRDAERFWRERFADAPQPLALPRPIADHADRRVTARISSSVLDACEALGATEGSTVFAVLLAAYAAYLSTVTQRADTVLCTPAVGRERDELQGIIGYINNVLPLRLRVDDSLTFRDVMRTVRHDVLRALEWQDLPFQDIASLPETQRIPLTRGMFAYSARSIRSLRLAGCDVSSLPIPDRSADFDLGLSIEDGDATLSLRDGVLGEVAPTEFLERWIDFLDHVVAHPDRPLRELQSLISIPTLPVAEHRPTRPRHMADDADANDTTAMVVGLTLDPLELQIAVIWERLFDIHPIAPDDDFFALGGHSLLAVRMLETIEREMGTRLTLATLAANPTVRALAAVLTSSGWEPERGSLIPMKGSGDGVPIVLLHSFEGHLFLYNELASHLGTQHPVYGCQAVGIDGTADPLHTVEEMASHYLALIDQRLGDGPVVLAAMCFGVSVGLEMARRRSSAGKPTHLMLIDSAWEHVVSFQVDGPRATVAERLRARATHELTRGKYWVTESLRMITGSPYARREARIRRHTAKAWLDYTPRPFDGRITLFRTRITPPETRDWKVESLDVLAQGDYETVYVPGDHFTLLRAPFAASLADAMRTAVHRPAVQR